jgi:hypothetical protein
VNLARRGAPEAWVALGAEVGLAAGQITDRGHLAMDGTIIVMPPCLFRMVNH